jgi:hypothetical protein
MAYRIQKQCCKLIIDKLTERKGKASFILNCKFWNICSICTTFALRISYRILILFPGNL